MKSEVDMPKLLPLLLLVLIGGCVVTPAEREARMQREVDQMVYLYGPICDKLGYKRDSDPWRDCVLKLDTKDSYERFASRPATTSCFGHRGFFQCSRF
jgi:hypothetical protein